MNEAKSVVGSGDSEQFHRNEVNSDVIVDYDDVNAVDGVMKSFRKVTLGREIKVETSVRKSVAGVDVDNFENEGIFGRGGPMMPSMSVAGGAGSEGKTLFVGDLHWWTTDAELDAELVKYGSVKEVKFFIEKASGKSKGYCQVEFYDPSAASACKEGMHGHLFNGKPCIVAFASPSNIKRMPQ